MTRSTAWQNATCIDAHNHVADTGAAQFVRPTGKLNREHAAGLLAEADRLAIDALCVSYPLVSESPRPEEVRLANDTVLEAMAFSDRFLGFCFLNPGYARPALDEIERCVVDGGMAGIKLYHQYFVCDPALAPVMERAAELQVPVLVHAGKAMSVAFKAGQPRISDGSHFVKAAAMFPETILIEAHIGGGGDWEWSLRFLEERRPKLYLDTGGSVVDAGLVDKSVAALGVDHVLFATDGAFDAGVGKIADAGLTEAERALVFAGNLKAIFAGRRA